MIPLIPLLTDTDIVSTSITAESIVHEWGVLVFEANGDVHCEGPWETMYGDASEAEAKAPVVWIHGTPFTGTFTVTVNGGDLTYVYPEPAASSAGQAIWELYGNLFITLEETPCTGPFSWGIESWRAVPSLHLSHSNTPAAENFLYYECDAPPDLAEAFLGRTGEGEMHFNTDNIPEAMLFSGEDVYLLEVQEDRIIPLNMEVNPELAEETVCRWANSGLKSSEILALLETWEPVWTADDQIWMVFPVPDEFHDSISTIELIRDDGGVVEYERLFLGAVRLAPGYV